MKRVDSEIEHLILRHHLVDQWPVGTIAKELGIHHDVVRRVVRQRGLTPQAAIKTRARMLDIYLPFIQQTLEKYPRLHASRLYLMVRERGYQGSEGHFRRLIAELRPRPAPEPFARLSMPAGEQAQVDWAHFGKIQVGRALRPLLRVHSDAFLVANVLPTILPRYGANEFSTRPRGCLHLP